MCSKGIPSMDEAKRILEEAEKLNPGPWGQHSLYVGQAARLIAESCKGMDPEKAYILGLLHDIGRRFGITNMRHSIDGYNFAINNNYHLVARICLTHSFPAKNIKEAFGKWDCSNDEYSYVDNYIKSVEYDDYDRLIQLCDALTFLSITV